MNAAHNGLQVVNSAYGPVAESIGTVFLVASQYPNSQFFTSVAIEAQYESIRHLTVAQRVEFFLIIALHVPLDAGHAVDFMELILREAPDAFVDRARDYLNHSPIGTDEAARLERIAAGVEKLRDRSP